MQIIILILTTLTIISGCSFKKNSDKPQGNSTKTIVESELKGDDKNKNDLIDSVSNDSLADLNESIKKNSLDLNFFNKDGVSPLSAAFKRDRLDIIQLLLKNGASLYFNDRNNRAFLGGLASIEGDYLRKNQKAQEKSATDVETTNEDIAQRPSNTLDESTENKDDVLMSTKMQSDLEAISKFVKDKNYDEIISYGKKQSLSCEDSLAFIITAVQVTPSIQVSALQEALKKISCKKINDALISAQLYQFEWLRQQDLNFQSTELLSNIIDITHPYTLNLISYPDEDSYVEFSPALLINARSKAKNKESFKELIHKYNIADDNTLVIYGMNNSPIKRLEIDKNFNSDDPESDLQDADIWVCLIGPLQGAERCDQTQLAHLLSNPDSPGL